MSIIQGSAKQGATRGFYPISIEQSLRFNDNDSAYLSRTPASAGDQKTWTFSCWFKIGSLTTTGILFSAGINIDNRVLVQLNSNDELQLFIENSGTFYQLRTSSLYRDHSSWYHVVAYVDTTQVTPSDRLYMAVNGQQITAFAAETYPTLNLDTYANRTNAHSIGSVAYSLGALPFDGYLAEVHFTDGTAYDADAFGELKSGVWVAKTPSVAYGTNGFYLDFANSADIGNDVSGEGNDWTPSIGLTASDVVLDSPTDNFATLNPLHKNTQAQIYSDGNLRFQASGSTTQFSAVVASQTADTGKWYCEYTVNSPSNRSICGFANIDKANIAGAADYYAGIDAYGAGLYSNGGEFLGTTASLPAAGALSDGDVVMLAMNLDDGYLYWGKNGTWFNSADPAAGTSTGAEAVDDIGADGTYAFVFAGRNSMITDVNFGQSGFTYTPPTDYLALSTANLPEPTISPADDASPEDYFNTVLYTGDGTSARTISGVGYQPDFSWIKNRSSTGANVLIDSVRGGGKQLFSDKTNAEQTDANVTDGFASDGFIVGDNSTGSGSTNANTDSYVAWNWKANGSGVSNTDGSIESQVSANTTSGFSISTFTTPASGNFDVGHGLDTAPDMFIVKSRETSGFIWLVYHRSAGAGGYLVLNTTAAFFTDTTTFQNTNPDSTLIYGDAADWGGNEDYVCYAFHSVEGFSKFGSYTGNGSTDGTFVYTGFRPAFILIKDVDDVKNWYLADNKRSPVNVNAAYLSPNLANKEDTSGDATNSYFDILSNGFKMRQNFTHLNASGKTHIYMAFAENPFKYSNAR